MCSTGIKDIADAMTIKMHVEAFKGRYQGDLRWFVLRQAFIMSTAVVRLSNGGNISLKSQIMLVFVAA